MWVELPHKTSDLQHSSSRRPCEIYLDIIIDAPAHALHCIVFQNSSHTAHLTIQQAIPEPYADGKPTHPPHMSDPPSPRFTTVLRRHALMRSAHFEEDAFAWHAIYKPQMSPLHPCGTLRLRLFLYNPSPLWRSFRLANLAFYSYDASQKPVERPLAGGPPSWFTLDNLIAAAKEGGRHGWRTAETEREGRGVLRSQDISVEHLYVSESTHDTP
ncbi:unnamed protein product [Vitrella brassicaformis CCMP3155]|uniref:Uncharacterized protein n=2 Tax=Vitrella brassicaformis TaxID=1169539 RepID=A0A0G4ELV6_VITBC|nr:unnamed protein product [Vitrella brassicaformis CCMP3155]|eukprot:CEL97818.1 unnamed protein product [Vitrella brassicaformis CCMP3155]